jgi:hypothetical protein
LVASAAFELNFDFFGQAVIPAVQKAVQRLEAAGLTFVTPLLPLDTASRTS